MDFKKLLAYKKAFELAMIIFKVSKSFPKSETYPITDQTRRCSRSVCSNIAEAYRKRSYPKHFTSKLSDSDAENSETSVWIDFALKCQYINNDIYNLIDRNIEVGKLINNMIKNPTKFGVKNID